MFYKYLKVIFFLSLFTVVSQAQESLIDDGLVEKDSLIKVKCVGEKYTDPIYLSVENVRFYNQGLVVEGKRFNVKSNYPGVYYDYSPYGGEINEAKTNSDRDRFLTKSCEQRQIEVSLNEDSEIYICGQGSVIKKNITFGDIVDITPMIEYNFIDKSDSLVNLGSISSCP